MTDTSVSSFCDVDGCFNVRDAGGWSTTDGRRVRTGVLLRADEPTRMTPAGRAVIDGLGLRAVIDLRGRSERGPGPGFAAPRVTHHLPVIDRVIATDAPRRIESASDIARLYDEMLVLRRDQFVRAIEIIARESARGPVLVHCKAGKDRTGMVIALVHAAVGVAIDSIVEDYARSDGPTRLRRTVMAADPRPGDPVLVSSEALIWTAPAGAMQQFVAANLERHGSLEDWVLAIGVRRRTIGTLRANLLTA